MREEKLLYIFRGNQGSGKSKLSQIVIQDDSLIFESDKFAGIYTENNVYVKDKQSDSHQWNLEQVTIACKDGLSPIAVANTSMERWNYQPYLDLAGRYDYTSIIVHCEGIEYSSWGNATNKGDGTNSWYSHKNGVLEKAR